MEDKTFDCDKRLYCLVCLCKLSKVFDFGSLFNQYPNWNLLKGKLYVLRHRIDSSRTRHLQHTILSGVCFETSRDKNCQCHRVRVPVSTRVKDWPNCVRAFWPSPRLPQPLVKDAGGWGSICQHCRGERVNKFITLTVSLLLGNVHSIPDSLLTVNIYRLCTAIRGISNIVGPWTETFSAVMSLST